MISAIELRKSIETCEVQHPAFVTHFDGLKRRIDDALAGFAPRVEWLIGPSRVGKTVLLLALARMYPESRVDGRRHVPVLFVPVSQSISPTLLPMNVLSALKVPISPRESSGKLFERMEEQLRLTGTKVLLFEEASHLVEPGSRVPPRGAGDWFKTVVERLNITVIMTGVPRLQRLFASNEQLRLRASARREFRPYSFQIAADQLAFAASVRTYVEIFRQAGWNIDMPFELFVKHCYLLSGGLVGVLSKFMQELVGQVADQAPRALTFDDCVAACTAIEHAGHPMSPPFERQEVAPIELSQVHAHVLEFSEMPMRRSA